MINKIKQKLQEIKDIVYFDADSHTYYVMGEEYTSVSNTLTWFKKDMEKIPKDILDRAIERGVYIHNLAEQAVNKYGLDCLDKLDEFKDNNFKDEWENYLINLFAFYHEKKQDGWELLATEQVLISKTDKIAGTADLLLYKQVDEVIHIRIVDYKTGALRTSNYLQVELYRLMLENALKRLKTPIKIKSELISLK